MTSERVRQLDVCGLVTHLSGAEWDSPAPLRSEQSQLRFAQPAQLGQVDGGRVEPA
jgi:hypothetical protein